MLGMRRVLCNMDGVQRDGRLCQAPFFPFLHSLSARMSMSLATTATRFLHPFSLHRFLIVGPAHPFPPPPSAFPITDDELTPRFCLLLCHKRLRRRQCILSCAFHDRVDEDEIYWGRRKQDAESAWSDNSAHVISQLAQCFTNAMVGPRAWIGGILSRSGNKRFGSDKILDYTPTPEEEESLQKLQERFGVPFDESRPDHQEALLALWDLAFPDVELKGMVSEQWKDMGWQGSNPATDFRGCGFLALENLLFFARNYPDCFHRLLFKEVGDRATWEYPFAVAGINVSFMLIQMLDLSSAKPKCLPGINFIKLLAGDEEAFDVLYCITFALMDAQWLAMHASYMEFNEVLQVTRIQLERELSLEDIHNITDLPAFNLM